MELLILLYLTGFLRTLLFILMIYYGLKLVKHYLMPKVVDKAADKLYRDMKKKSAAGQKQQRKPGDVTIERPNQSQKKYSRNDGDYIEFEEID